MALVTQPGRWAWKLVSNETPRLPQLLLVGKSSQGAWGGGEARRGQSLEQDLGMTDHSPGEGTGTRASSFSSTMTKEG